MARQCEITGKKALVGNNVSHAKNKLKRRQKLNLITKKIWVEEQNKFVKVKLSTRALKTIRRNGAASVLAKAGIA